MSDELTPAENDESKETKKPKTYVEPCILPKSDRLGHWQLPGFYPRHVKTLRHDDELRIED